MAVELKGIVLVLLACFLGYTSAVGVPLGSPKIVSSTRVGDTSLRLQWELLPSNETNGIIEGYVIFYKDGSQLTYSNKTIYDNTTTRSSVDGLVKENDYCFKMAAFTKDGLSGDWKTANCYWARIEGGVSTTETTGQSNFTEQSTKVTNTTSHPKNESTSRTTPHTKEPSTAGASTGKLQFSLLQYQVLFVSAFMAYCDL